MQKASKILENHTKNMLLSFPNKIQQLNFLGHSTLPMSIDSKCPTLADRNYHSRRIMIGKLSENHIIGAKIQQVNYTQQEHQLWKTMFAKAYPYRRQLMCQSYLQNLHQLMLQMNFHERIPKINQISKYLKSKTGFQIKPVAGIVTQRQFLNCLAFKVFCCGQFLRHPLCEQFAPQPDIVHEYVGHIPALADKKIAAISHQIGLMSLGASDQDLSRLGDAYLHSLQFGICRQKGQIKAYGAGICGCIADLKKIKEKRFRSVMFDPISEIQREEFNYVVQQDRFWLTQTFQDALLKLRELNTTLKKPFDCKLNQLTDNIEIAYKCQQ